MRTSREVSPNDTERPDNSLQAVVDSLRDVKSSGALDSQLFDDPAATIQIIRRMELGKYDTQIARLISEIGSPAADCLAGELMGLIADLNWPVHLAALDALFSLDRAVLIQAAAELVYDQRYQVLRTFCYHARFKAPDLLPRIRPALEEAIEDMRECSEDLSAYLSGNDHGTERVEPPAGRL